ncbi:tetratricopeptide repeat protein [Streptomyces sp. NPDC002574]|uniref:tetratricopeptide repeat protein n=1 Tax=Streptomyces sp. NPDC002574 TaxID=3364652 RepID=UPI0036914570
MVRGPDHRDTLDCRHQHARFIGEAGNPAEAVRLMVELVADCERIMGTDHPGTRDSRYHLAYWQRRAALH